MARSKPGLYPEQIGQAGAILAELARTCFNINTAWPIEADGGKIVTIARLGREAHELLYGKGDKP